MKKANRLPQPQAFELRDWVKENAERVKTEPFPKLAEEAAQALGFPVTEPNVRTVAASLKIERPKRERKAKKLSKADAITHLAAAILDMAHKLGVDPVNAVVIEQLAGNEAQEELLLTERV